MPVQKLQAEFLATVLLGILFEDIVVSLTVDGSVHTLNDLIHSITGHHKRVVEQNAVNVKPLQSITQTRFNIRKPVYHVTAKFDTGSSM